MIVLNLPLPPTVNHYIKSSGYRRYLSKEAVEFKKQVADYVSEYKVPKLGDARIEMHITIHFANKRRQDLDNRVKSLWDSLGGNGAGVFDDDSQIDVLFLQIPVKSSKPVPEWHFGISQCFAVGNIFF